MLVWPSCPQACITPGCSEAKASPLSSCESGQGGPKEGANTLAATLRDCPSSARAVCRGDEALEHPCPGRNKKRCSLRPQPPSCPEAASPFALPGAPTANSTHLVGLATTPRRRRPLRSPHPGPQPHPKQPPRHHPHFHLNREGVHVSPQRHHGFAAPQLRHHAGLGQGAVWDAQLIQRAPAKGRPGWRTSAHGAGAPRHAGRVVPCSLPRPVCHCRQGSAWNRLLGNSAANGQVREVSGLGAPPCGLEGAQTCTAHTAWLSVSGTAYRTSRLVSVS